LPSCPENRGRSGERNFEKKNKLFEHRESGASFCFSEISLGAQANFKQALIFWSFLIKQKGHYFLIIPLKISSKYSLKI
jgi:hypothetical protein